MDVRSYEADKIIHEVIRGTAKVGEIAKKIQEKRSKWYRHAMRRD